MSSISSTGPALSLWRSALLGALASLVFAAPAQAANPAFDEGIEYQRISPPQPEAEPGKIEVREFFWYGCPHCFQFEPYKDRWLATKPADVNFIMAPAVLNPNWELHARAYFTADALGALERAHKPLFEAIHAKRRSLNSEEALAAFFAEHGVPQDQFRKAFNSFGVQTQMQRARLANERYGINGVPTLVVAGKYRTSASMAGSNEAMLDVVNFLINQERAQRGGNSAP